MDFLKNEFKFWRYLINFWSFVFFLFIILDFFSSNGYKDLLNIISVVYISALALYSSNKEFERWYDQHESKHPGEVFVVIWSILIFFLFGLSFIFRGTYQIPTSVISSYIAVLTILAVTKKSKEMYIIKHKPLKRKVTKK
jgi:Na+/H+ antiporter NhaD/arsenite permease-like protein